MLINAEPGTESLCRYKYGERFPAHTSYVLDSCIAWLIQVFLGVDPISLLAFCPPIEPKPMRVKRW